MAAAGVGASAGSVHTGTNVGVGVGVGVAAAKSSGILPMSIPASPSTPFVSIGTNMSTSPTTTPHQQQQQHTAVGGGHVSSNISIGANQPVSGGTMNTFIVTELQDEKLRLLATLKSFEREFTKRHGRPVTKHEDIAPVSTEYKRYKEIKAILHES